MKIPTSNGIWPAFWLRSDYTKLVEGTEYYGEIDIIEYYPSNTNRYQIDVHRWPIDSGTHYAYPIHNVYTEANDLTNDFHLYGVEIESENIVFYFDRKEIYRMTKTAESDQPMLFILDLALVDNYNLADDPCVLEVDYVKVFERT